MMGSNKGDFDEKPVHAVTITEPFAVGKYEVMWDEWEVCIFTERHAPAPRQGH